MQTRFLVTVALSAIGCGNAGTGPERDVDARDLADAGVPDAILTDAAPACGVHASGGYAAIDPAYGVRTIDVGRVVHLGQVARDPLGRLVVELDDYDQFRPMTTDFMIRIAADGALDESFGDHGRVEMVATRSDGQPTYPLDELEIDELGRIYVNVPNEDVGDRNNDTIIRRYTEDGAPDSTFGTVAGGVALVPGNFSNGNESWTTIGRSLVMAKYNAVRLADDGTVAATMALDHDYIDSVAGDAHTTYLGGGLADEVSAFDATGELVTSFGTGGAVTVSSTPAAYGVRTIAVGADGTIDVETDDTGGLSAQKLVRLTAAGTFDPSFAGGAGVSLGGGPYPIVRRCDGADVLTSFNAGTLVLDRGGSQLSANPWGWTGQVAGYDDTDGALIMIRDPRPDGSTDPLVIETARLLP